jgi:hypothetical protein
MKAERERNMEVPKSRTSSTDDCPIIFDKVEFRITSKLKESVFFGTIEQDISSTWLRLVLCWMNGHRTCGEL